MRNPTRPSPRSLLSCILVLICAGTALPAGKVRTAQPTPYLRGDLSSADGAEDCNPCLNNVIEAINTLNDHGETIGFNWGAHYPEVLGARTSNHWQGVQRLYSGSLSQPYFVISSSHRRDVMKPDGSIESVSNPAYFAVVEMGSRNHDGGRLRSNRLEFGRLTRNVKPNPLDRIIRANKVTSDFDHPGGLQSIGKYVMVGVDHPILHSRDTVLFTLWDMSNPAKPVNVWGDPPWEVGGENPGSVGIVKLESGRFLILRALKDAKKLEFYMLEHGLRTNPATYHDGEVWDRWSYQELRSEVANPDGSIDMNWADLGAVLGRAGYQTTNIVTECGSGALFLIASHGRRPSGFGGADYIDAFRLDVPAERPGSDSGDAGVVITKVAKRRLFPEGNAGARQGDLQAAAGAYVSPDHRLYFYASEHGVSGEGSYVKMIEFGPRVPRERVTAIEDAWVMLYERKGFGGRSIALDYIDKNLRDYGNFSNIESFDRVASSIIYAIPRGYALLLYTETNHEGDSIQLTGTGRVEKVSDLGAIHVGHDDTADNKFRSARWRYLARATNGQTSHEPPHFELYQSYPDSFSVETTISYQSRRPAMVHLDIFDRHGNLVRRLVARKQSGGLHTVQWDGTDDRGKTLAGGPYFYRLKIGEHTKVRGMVVLR